MTIVLTKLISTAIIVLLLSLIAERAGPKLAGILSGLPLGSAIVLFYIGIEQGPDFAAQSGISMVLGLSASLAFLLTYWLINKFIFTGSSIPSIALTAATSIVAFCGCALILSKVPEVPSLWVLITLSCAVLSILIFKKIPDTKIKDKVSFTTKMLLIRVSIATAVVLIITGFAELLGSFKIGLLSGFPVTLFPLLLIIHHTYSPSNVWTIIKNFPMGMGSLIIYGICVSIFYPPHGVVLGTFISFCLSLSYTIAISLVLRKQ